ncbi:A/G-specific DNA-adenine glycosylase [Pilibacter termitis]|jgi:A/G-specific adenine glycosylase|uniref:Adenine DNA glycosylase n=1 Tax=Pilibacter termitis TaxID=263852 RepID=A0A1T4M0L5_9ENTE|nr:A/G-specific adenine glycosylase [Pilibacter termitis]SJZ60435.1 A/G-specific DNA-adenine glycosylase [Pilibacter termitis]
MKNNWEKWGNTEISTFQQDFLSWYFKNKRNLPWRENTEAYRVWISEIMLQQTRVETVIDYFYRFMEKYPNISDLANANEEELLKIWEGLGYYSRARNLKIAATQIMEEFNGIFPSTPHEISTLKGIGPYTTGAIASISFGLPEPAIDGNVQRVTSRLFEIEHDISKTSSRKIFDLCMRKIISHEYAGDFNQALMDLGSRICTPTSPKCEECPIQNYCLSYQKDTQLNFPVKTKKLKQKPLYYVALAMQNEQGEYYLKQRKDTGLLANMWTFPLIEVGKSEYNEFLKKKREFLGSEEFEDFIFTKEPLGEVTHIFSHLKWHILLFRGFEKENFLLSEKKFDEKSVWAKEDDYAKLVFPKPQIKLFELLKMENENS